MRPEAVEHAGIALKRLGNAFDRILKSKSHDESEEAWDHFLQSHARIYEKLKAGARDTESWSWFVEKRNLRRDDPLLRYLHHARNADHHRLEMTVEPNPYKVSIGAVGSVFVEKIEIKDGRVVQAKHMPLTAGSSLRLNEEIGHLTALPVLDKGVTYDVPKSHLGENFQSANVRDLAACGFVYAEELVEEANSLIR